jgi:hypothetical protein
MHRIIKPPITRVRSNSRVGVLQVLNRRVESSSHRQGPALSAISWQEIDNRYPDQPQYGPQARGSSSTITAEMVPQVDQNRPSANLGLSSAEGFVGQVVGTARIGRYHSRSAAAAFRVGRL